MGKSTLNIRISQKDKDIFYGVCDRKALTPSKVIRRMIEVFCIKNRGKALQIRKARQQMK